MLLDPPDPGRPEMLGRLGPYEVIEVLGQGGMGVVLKARDPALDRTVAIKLLNPALAHGPTARRRFAREARAAAAVGHDHIVAIYAVDEFRGLPYLVMQYIPGRSLQERLDETGPLSVPEILRIGTQAARALAAAHAQGVVHRDIKPANILLENCVERVKLTDFGLARAIDDASLTQSGVIAGTPQYMAPEQARGEAVDARSDLFSLGAVLYAMAGGRPPFRADSAMAVLKRVCDDRHRAIRELSPEIPDWLEAVIDRLLTKDPADRLQSAAEVADLLERGLAHVQQPTAVPRPIVPGLMIVEPPLLEFELPMAKPAPRPRRRLALAASLALLSLAGLGVSEAAGLTQVTEFVATILRIKTPEGTLVIKVDDPGVKVGVDGEVLVIGGAGPQEIRLKTGRHRVLATRDGHPVREQVVTVSRGTKQIVEIDLEATPVPVEPRTGQALEPPVPRSHESQCMVCHEAANVLDRALPPNHPEPGLYLLRDGRVVPPPPPDPTTLARQRGLVWSLAFSPDGRRLAIGQQGIEGWPSLLRVWDLKRQQDVIWVTHSSPYRSVAFSWDGQTLGAVTFDGKLQLWKLDGDVAHSIPGHDAAGSPINALVFLPRTQQPVYGMWDGRVEYFNGKPIQLTYPGKVFALAASPDGKTLAVGGEAGLIHLHDADSGKLKATCGGHDGPVESLDFSPDGKTLASASWDKTIRVWDVSSGREIRRLAHSQAERLAVRFSPDGKTLACAQGKHDRPHTESFPCFVQLWDSTEGRLLYTLGGHTGSIFALAFSPDGKTLASGSMDQTVKLWDPVSGQLRETIVPGETGTSLGMGGSGGLGGMGEAMIPPLWPRENPAGIPSVSLREPMAVLALGHEVEARSVAFSPDGSTLVAGGSNGILMRWDFCDLPGSGRALGGQSSGVNAVAYSHDGKLVATANADHTIGLRDADGNELALLKGHTDAVRSVAFAPDGKLLASGSWDRTTKVWDVATRRELRTFPTQQKPVNAVAFSPYGHLLAAGSGDWHTDKPGEVALWDPATGEHVSLAWHAPRDVKALAYSGNARQLAVACGSAKESVAVVHLSARSPVSLRYHLTTHVTTFDCPTGATAVAYSPDGKMLAASQQNGKLRLWDAVSLAPLTAGPIPLHSSMIFDLTFSPDGQHLATASKDGTVKIWAVNELIQDDPRARARR
jgi:WD40 repeat protein